MIIKISQFSVTAVDWSLVEQGIQNTHDMIPSSIEHIELLASMGDEVIGAELGLFLYSRAPDILAQIEPTLKEAKDRTLTAYKVNSSYGNIQRSWDDLQNESKKLVDKLPTGFPQMVNDAFSRTSTNIDRHHQIITSLF